MLRKKTWKMGITTLLVIGRTMAFSMLPAPCFTQKGKVYGKHSAVLAAFRQYFIKTGEFDKKWSDDYEFIMDSRHTADYDLYDAVDEEDTLLVLEKARGFVEEVKKWLQKQDLL